MEKELANNDTQILLLKLAQAENEEEINTIIANHPVLQKMKIGNPLQENVQILDLHMRSRQVLSQL